MLTALDTNIISALWASEPLAARIEARILHAKQQGGLVISAPVYAELMAHPFAKGGFVDEFLEATKINVDFVLGENVWREAARGFAEYAGRRRKAKSGQPKRFLADFAIGAHALLRTDQLFTMDRTRYVQSFPKLKLLPDRVM